MPQFRSTFITNYVYRDYWFPLISIMNGYGYDYKRPTDAYKKVSGSIIKNNEDRYVKSTLTCNH
jgi:hypothetical protein